MTQRVVRLRRAAQVSAVAVGLSVLMLSVVTSALTSRNRQVEAQDGKLGVTLSQQMDALEDYFEQAQMVDQLLAANPAFTDFYQAPGTNQQKIDAGGALLRGVNDALASLETLFPGRIGEACFIDQNGSEIARVVDGVAATAGNLSQDEAENAFFAPTLALGPGKVYQAEKYRSEDTHDDVISNSTVVEAAGHRGMVHFEIALSSFRMPATATGLTASIIDADSRQVLVSSLGTGADQHLTGVTAQARDTGVTTIGSQRVAFRRLAATENNANSWYVAVSAPAVTAGWTRGLSVGSLALVAVALLTIVVAGVSGWNQLRAARRAALHDTLTGLPNRELLRLNLQSALRSGRPASVLAIDLERFKEVNDQLGYPHGDLLLRQVAERLTSTAPADATVARLGGDDFAVLLPGAGQATAEAMAELLLAELHRTFEIDGAGLDVEARIGVACAAADDIEGDALLRHADAAMQLAKAHHDGTQTYDPAVDRHASNRLALVGDLRRALETDDQLIVYYQPKVHLADGGLAGAEALVRWEHPTLGRIAPDQFIPLAETTTLIHALTDRVLAIAVRQAKAWQDNGLHLPVAVNLSTRCLHDRTLPGRVFELLERTGLPPSLLELEITESMVMADPERALSVLDALHAGGLRLSVDDFGTGHSSMAYLQRLPVDELKIDRSFVQQMSAGAAGSVLVRTAIGLGHSLGLSVVAEGIEDAATAAELRDLGCDIAQGYHFGKPMPADELYRLAAPGRQALSRR
ncbi:bifunctional diguanylate cyclase/phosphodiesterase [Actinoplanes sp. NPDC026619]|uniref:putative bifunctional diguanylate cyclase/phosphodiesterase n=1 Tax=Actinoplanes sp. NPDC026619 TaxID=3155798 RepID=UPI0033D7B630